MLVCLKPTYSAPKKCPTETIAITHDDDLRLIDNAVRPGEKTIGLDATGNAMG